MNEEVIPENTNTFEINHLSLSGNTKDFLTEITKWAFFLSIIGFIITGLLLISGFIGIASLWSNNSIPVFAGIILGIFNILIAVIYLLPVLYLYRFSTIARNAIKLGNSEEMEMAFKNLKRHYRFIGILTLVILGIYVLSMFAALFVGLSFFNM
ncbi:MAG: DUF5362 family protein [Bacteroidota bacterium]|nr:DUF5362 family protein [Bacteroidota bacterium]